MGSQVQQPTKNSSVILIVEDSDVTRRLLQSILAREGYQTLTATNGAEGWQLLMQSAVDLVFSDVMMPEMTGLELCVRVRDTPTLAHIPVILCTGAMDPKINQACLDSEANACLQKPIPIDVILQTIKRFLP
jgi:CheY-like chemotaxis protein